MTQNEWAEVEKKLWMAGCVVWLNCDGYRLTIERRRRTEMRDCLMVFVNGVFDPKLTREDCEERRRFCCPRERFVYKPKEREARRASIKKMGKRIYEDLRKRFGPLMEPDKTFTFYSNAWPNMKKLRAHLVKNNKEISVW